MKPILPKSIISPTGLSQVCSVLTPGTTIILGPPFLRGTFGEAHQGLCLPASQNVPQPTPVILPLATTKSPDDHQLSNPYPQTEKSSKSKKEKGREVCGSNFKKSIVKNILPKVSQLDTRTLIIIPSSVNAYLPNTCATKAALKPNSAKKCKAILQKWSDEGGDVSHNEIQALKSIDESLTQNYKCTSIPSKELQVRKTKGSAKDVKTSKSKKIEPTFNVKQNAKEYIDDILTRESTELTRVSASNQLAPKSKEQCLPDHAIPHHPPPPYPRLIEFNKKSKSPFEESSKQSCKEKYNVPSRSHGENASHLPKQSYNSKQSDPTSHYQVKQKNRVLNCNSSLASHACNFGEQSMIVGLHHTNNYGNSTCSFANTPVCSSLTEQRNPAVSFVKSKLSIADPPSYSSSSHSVEYPSLSVKQPTSCFAGNYNGKSVHSHTPSNNSPAVMRFSSVSNSGINSACHEQFSTSFSETTHMVLKRVTTEDTAVPAESPIYQSFSSTHSGATSNIVFQETSNSYMKKPADYRGSSHVDSFTNSSQGYSEVPQQVSPYTGPMTPTSYSHSPQISAYGQSPQPNTYVASTHYDTNMCLQSSTYSHSPQAFYSPSHSSSSYSNLHHQNLYRSSQEMSQSGLMKGEMQSSHAMHHSLTNTQEYSISHQSTYCQSPEAIAIKVRHASDNVNGDCQSPLLPPYSFSHLSSPSPCTSKSPNMYASDQNTQQVDTVNDQKHLENKNITQVFSSHSYCNEEFASATLSPPSYEAHFQNSNAFSSASHTSSSDMRSNVSYQQQPSSYTLYSHNSRFAEHNFSNIAVDLRDNIVSPPAYPTSSSSLSLPLPPPGYTTDPHMNSVGQQLHYPFTPDICHDSQEYNSPLENTGHFFPNTPPILPPPAAAPPTDNSFNLPSANTSQDIGATHSATSHPQYFASSSSNPEHFECPEVFEERTVHKDIDSYEYHMYNLDDASTSTWKNGNTDSTKVHDLIEKAEGLWFIPHQEQNRVYLKRKELAKDILNYSAAKSCRDSTLKEKFWIEEDEPISDEIVNAANTNSLEEEQLLNDDSLPHQSELENNLTRVKMTLVKSRSVTKKNKDMLCQICGKILKGINSLKSHLNSHHKIQPHACPYCSKSFSNRSVLVQHLRIHTGEKPYLCAICDTAFRTRTALKRHQSLHTNERPFECSMCSKAFKTKLVLQQHLKLHLMGLFTCSICSKTFERQKSYIVHKASHEHSKKRYRCTHCSKTYRFRSLLNYHMQMHANIRKHVCAVCSEAFVWRSGLAAHMKTHSVSRPKCDICSASFPSEKRLEVHYRRHSNKKPHKCEECGQSFAYAYRLNSHKMVHQKRKEYLCTKCGLVFNSGKMLKKHSVIHKDSSFQADSSLAMSHL